MSFDCDGDKVEPFFVGGSGEGGDGHEGVEVVRGVIAAGGVVPQTDGGESGDGRELQILADVEEGDTDAGGIFYGQSEKNPSARVPQYDLLSAALLPTYTHVTEKQDTHMLVSIRGSLSAETYPEPATALSDPAAHRDAAVECRPPDLPRAHRSHPGVFPAVCR